MTTSLIHRALPALLVVEDGIVEHDSTDVDRRQTEEAAQHRRLTGAVRPENGECLAVVHLERGFEVESIPSNTNGGVQGHERVTSFGLPSHRSRSPMSTANDTTISTMLRTSAAPGSVSSAR